ncbi:hypothetical protein A6V25_01910 [Nostoc sp. ATCC 53789]|nr:hypothetical protein A6V25_01910 [Nostoc sp. ATCC 53789]
MYRIKFIKKNSEVRMGYACNTVRLSNFLVEAGRGRREVGGQYFSVKGERGKGKGLNFPFPFPL